ncbi:MAG TPA: prolipoprotein diacylglyceryl transferase family protein [Lacipirellulaceae bacterium]|jgi:phosphatidylglycerol:prolipoprotein diacylglycerol transferase|nr:prolipoprotein diacylglyceryl transferase family protein [Lacipirellulaceae bacterium]
MCSELFQIPYEIGGVPIFGVGVLLAIWAVVAAATIIGMVRQFGWSAETFGSLPLMLLLGAAIVFLPRVFPDGMPIRGYGVLLLVGITSGVALAMLRAKQAGLNPELILSLAIWLVVCGVIGARLFHVVEYWDTKFAGRPPVETLLEILNVPEGGLVIYGALFGGAVGLVAFTRKHRLPLLSMADLVAPSLMVGLAFGRIGCLLNGCCYGGQTDLPWAVTFPKLSSRFEEPKSGMPRYSPPYFDQAVHGEMHGFRLDVDEQGRLIVTRVEPKSRAAAAGLSKGDVVATINGRHVASMENVKPIMLTALETGTNLRLGLATGKTVEIAAAPMPPRSRPVHPTQVYSAIDAGILGWLLWSFYPFRRRDGETIALLLTIHPITRFLLEIIRTDEPAVFGTGMSISQNISILLLACGLALWWYLSKQPRGIVWPLATAAAPQKQAVPRRAEAAARRS